MRYCGIDVSLLSSFIYIADVNGTRVLAREVKTEKSDFSSALRPYVARGLKIAIEAGNQTSWIYEFLTKLGAEVTVVNPNKVKAIAQSRRKTDKIDAKLLCELLRMNGLPTAVHMPCSETRSLRALLGARRQLIHARTVLCNTVRGQLRQEGIRLPAKALLSKKGWQKLLTAHYEASHIQPLLQAYHGSFLALGESLRKLESQLKERATNDPRVELLRTMPSVGLIAALTLLGAVGQIERFGSSRRLSSYSGLTPTLRQSGERAQYGPISREGRRELRAVWVQIAHLVANDQRGPAKPLRRWFLKLAKRRGKKTALVALARKLLSIAYQMLKTGEVYNAMHVGRQAA